MYKIINKDKVIVYKLFGLINIKVNIKINNNIEDLELCAFNMAVDSNSHPILDAALAVPGSEIKRTNIKISITSRSKLKELGKWIHTKQTQLFKKRELTKNVLVKIKFM